MDDFEVATPTIKDMADLTGRRLTTRPWRVDRAVTAVQSRFALLLPDGESLEAGRAIWTLSSTPLLVANGVIRYRRHGLPRSGQ